MSGRGSVRNQYIQVVTTTAARKDAERIARVLLEKRLAGCVQIVGPLRSLYRWKGAVETSGEWMCLIKSRASRYASLERAIRENHPYEVPEILALPVLRGSKAYLEWLDAELKPPVQKRARSKS